MIEVFDGEVFDGFEKSGFVINLMSVFDIHDGN